MPRSRSTELPQRPSPRAPHRLQAHVSDSNLIHHRSRSPKLSDPATHRKLGSRIADMESQLRQAQEELIFLKNQLISAKKLKRAPNSLQVQDVYEAATECLQFDEMLTLKRKLNEMVKELELIRDENVKMKRQLHDKSLQIEELRLRVKQGEQELEKSKDRGAQMEEMEDEMKMLRVRTEQWRKAADAAATMLEMDKLCGNVLGHGGDGDGGKRRGYGIRMFGEMWRKKGNN